MNIAEALAKDWFLGAAVIIGLLAVWFVWSFRSKDPLAGPIEGADLWVGMEPGDSGLAALARSATGTGTVDFNQHASPTFTEPQEVAPAQEQPPPGREYRSRVVHVGPGQTSPRGGCLGLSYIPKPLAVSYQADPGTLCSIYCQHCGKAFRKADYVWDGTEERVE